MATTMKTRAEDATDTNVKKKTIYQVNPMAIVFEDGFNVRNYDDPDVEANIEAFAVSFENKVPVPAILGWTQPDGTISPIEGHCRTLGAQRAMARNPGMELLISVEEFKGTPAQRRAAMMRSDGGLKFKTIEVAMGCLAMSDEDGLKNGEIAAINKITPARVEQLLLLARADAEVHRLVREGKVDAEAAIEVVRKQREAAAGFLAAKVEEGKERGETKVTRSTLKPWAPAPQIVASVIDTLQVALAGLDKQTRTALARFEAMPKEQMEAELAGKTFSIDGAALLALLKVNGDVADAKAAKEAKDAQKKSAASQGVLLAGVDADATPGKFVGGGVDDPQYAAAVKVASREMRTSVDSLRGALKVSAEHAEHLIETMLAEGIVSEAAPGLNGARGVQPAKA